MVYIFATKTPYQAEIARHAGGAGVIMGTTRVEGKVEGKKHCIICHKSINPNRFWEHCYVHQGPRFPCNECFGVFRSQEILDKHKIRTHEFVFKCPRCEFREAISEFRDICHMKYSTRTTNWRLEFWRERTSRIDLSEKRSRIDSSEKRSHL